MFLKNMEILPRVAVLFKLLQDECKIIQENMSGQVLWETILRPVIEILRKRALRGSFGVGKLFWRRVGSESTIREPQVGVEITFLLQIKELLSFLSKS